MAWARPSFAHQLRICFPMFPPNSDPRPRGLMSKPRAISLKASRVSERASWAALSSGRLIQSVDAAATLLMWLSSVAAPSTS